jgi:hypothetical protein
VSASLVKKLGLPSMTSDDVVGEQAFHDSDEIIGRVEAPTWRKWMRHGLAATFLSRVEIAGQEGFDEVVDATDRDAAPLEAEYERLRAERALAHRRELQRKASDIEIQREMKRADRETEFAKAYAVDRLRLFADSHGSRARIARVVAEAAAVLPGARPLELSELYMAAA